MMAIDHTIEERDDFFAVYEWSIYERSSVLAYQTRKRFVGSFDSESAALAAYPKATLNCRSAHNTFGHLPGEDDQMLGGAWPDDY